MDYGMMSLAYASSQENTSSSTEAFPSCEWRLKKWCILLARKEDQSFPLRYCQEADEIRYDSWLEKDTQKKIFPQFSTFQ